MNQSVQSMFQRYLSRQDLKANSILTKQRALKLYLEFIGDSLVGDVQPADAHELRAAYLTAVCETHGIKVAADAAGIVSLQTAARYDRSSKMATVAKASRVVSNSYMSNVP